MAKSSLQEPGKEQPEMDGGRFLLRTIPKVPKSLKAASLIP